MRPEEERLFGIFVEVVNGESSCWTRGSLVYILPVRGQYSMPLCGPELIIVAVSECMLTLHCELGPFGD